MRLAMKNPNQQTNKRTNRDGPSPVTAGEVIRRVTDKSFGFALLAGIAAFVLLIQGCKAQPPTNTPAESAPTKSTPAASPLTGFERDLQFIRNGQYTYVYVFARKDGKPLDKVDAAFLRTNAPQVVDWATSEGGKRVIGGTNFNLEEGGMAQLKKRFVVEDYSGK
jgi:hypothetical protein